MKRILALALSIIMAFSLLTGCGGEASVEDNSQTGSQEAETVDTAKTETSENISQETGSTPETVPVVTDDYVDTDPEKFARSKAPDYYLEVFDLMNSGKGLERDKEEVVIGNFSYRIRKYKDSDEKVAYCDDYVGPTEGGRKL